MVSIDRTDEQRIQRGYLGLLGLVIGLALGGLGLYAVAGPPHLPDALPSWEVVFLTLRGSSVPYAAIAYILGTVAWLLWIWMVASLVLRAAVVIAESLTNGAVWLLPVRALSDRLTLPIVRHVVDGALVALVVVNLAGRPASSAWAAPVTPTAIVVMSSPDPAARSASVAAEDHERDPGAIEYTVQPGDTLWAIAQRFYGTGVEFPRLVEANAGRQMGDGRRFTQQGVIYPGWVLLVPLPSLAVEEVDGDSCYVVEPGDTLSGIAARLLAADTRWREIFELNQGLARLEDGRVLRDPDLIWPGLRLRLPRETVGERQPQPPEPEASASAETLEVPAPGTPAPAETAAATLDATNLDGPVQEPAPGIAVGPVDASADHSLSTLGYGAAALAAAAAAGGAAFALRRRARRSLNEPPIAAEPPPPPNGDFAEAEFTRSLTHQIQGGATEPATLIAGQALRFLTEQGVDDVSVVMARQGRNATRLTLNAPLLTQSRLLELGGEFATHLGGKGLASLTSDHDVAFQVGSPKLAGVLPPVSPRRDLCLLPLGVSPSQETLYGNWCELGHVLLAGLPGGGTDVVLASLLSALAARRHPAELSFWMIAGRRELPREISELPHQRRWAEPGDTERVKALIHELQAELLRRMRLTEFATGSPAPSEDPELVLVVGEVGDLSDERDTLELIGAHGPTHGVRLIAITTTPAALDETLLAYFGTRLVLQTLDDAESVLLLGHPQAADLGAGDLLVRLDGRAPQRVQGFRVSRDHLAALVRLMREEAGSTARQTVSSPGDADLPEREPAPAYGEAPEEEHPPVSQVPQAGEGYAPSATRPHGNGQANGAEPGTQPVLPAGMENTREPDVLTGTQPEVSSNGHQLAWSLPGLQVRPAGAPDENGESAARHCLVEVRCFGEFEVRSGDRKITPALEDRLSFKSFELLAFLAAHPDGTASKEKVLAALWPEADEERGSKSMGVAMSRLRGLLARQVPGLSSKAVRCERDGACRLDPTLIWSDVQEFLAHCQSGAKLPPEEAKVALQQALALYRADLLADPGSRVYEWVDDLAETGISLRAAYREEHRQAIHRLARLFHRDGQAAQAIPLYKKLLESEPTLEDVVRQLYRCYHQLGDLSSLLREDRHLRQALQEAYYDAEDPDDDPKRYQPEPETVELLNSIRRELEGAMAAKVKDAEG